MTVMCFYTRGGRVLLFLKQQSNIGCDLCVKKLKKIHMLLVFLVMIINMYFK